jgi:hypothetical protein
VGCDAVQPVRNLPTILERRKDYSAPKLRALLSSEI